MAAARAQGIDKGALVKEVKQALYASKICSYAQGLNIIKAKSAEKDWGIDLGGLSRIWKARGTPRCLLHAASRQCNVLWGACAGQSSSAAKLRQVHVRSLPFLKTDLPSQITAPNADRGTKPSAAPFTGEHDAMCKAMCEGACAGLPAYNAAWAH